MLSTDEIGRLVRDFYELTLSVDDHRRLIPEQPWSEQEHAFRSDYLDDMLKRQRDALRRGDFDAVNLAAQVVMSRHEIVESELGPGEYNQIRQAFLRASIDIIEELRGRQNGDFNFDLRDSVLKAALAASIPTSAPAAPIATPMAFDGTSIPFVEEPPHPPVAPVHAKVVPPFEAVAEEFRLGRLATKTWDRQTAAQAKATYRLFAEICGNKALADYRRADAEQFRKKLSRLPWDYAKAARYRDKTVDEILAVAAAQAHTREVQLLAQRTVKRHFSTLSVLWESSHSAGEVTENIFDRFRFGSTKRASELRDMWAEPELKRLFSSPVYTGCKSELRRSEPGGLVLKDERYWLPLIALFSGMRQEEIAQLHVEDVKNVEEIVFFDVNDRPPRMLKNASAARSVPLHATLIRSGFLEYVEVCRKARQLRLFPNLKPGGADSRFGHAFSKWFTRYRRDIGVYRKGLDFHSFRHTASTLMHQAGVERAVIDHVTGHSTPGETSRYVKASALKQLKAAIDTIDVGFELLALASVSGARETYVRPRLRTKQRKSSRRPA